MMAVAPHLRPVLEAPFKVAGGVGVLGRALWLYEALVLRASDQGTVVRARQRLAEDLNVSEAEIDTWLKRLVDAKLIDLQSPSNFFVISLRSWPRSGVIVEDSDGATAADSSTDEAPADATATASKQAIYKKSKLSKLSKHGDEGAGEGDSLLAELRAVLGEADAADLQPFLADYPTAVVAHALERVKATPGRQIKKSRTALFRFLLKTFTNELHDQPPIIHHHA